MKKQILLIAVLAVMSALLLSCSPSLPNNYPNAKVSKTEAGNTLIVTENFSAVILTKGFVEANSPFVQPSGGYWTPQADQVLNIEASLEEYLLENTSKFRSGHIPNSEELSKYGRQYTGINDGDKKIIHGSFFCPHYSEDADWKNRVVAVKGGGECFFDIWYDWSEKEFIGFSVNAPE